MIKRKHLKLFSSLVVPATLLISLPFLNNNVVIENNNYKNNNDIVLNNINSPSTFTINQTYQINKEKFIENGQEKDFIFDKTKTSGEFNLISKSNNDNPNLNHSILDFARVIGSNGLLDENKRMENTLELDLNIWKPIGMDDDLFLQSINFDISGFIKTNQNNDSTRLMNYNITKKNYFNQAPSNFNNLDTEKVTYIKDENPPLPEKKLIFKVVNNKKDEENQYQSDKGYCYILLEVIHQKSEENNSKPNPNGINRLLITPKIGYAWNEKEDLQNFITTIPKQNITLTLKSNLFSYNESLRISNDSYVSDNQRFSLYEKPLDNSGDTNQDQKTNSFLTLDTSKAANEVIISPEASTTGNKIPYLNIDTSNFYFSNDYNQLKNKEFLVEIEGIEVKDGKIVKQKNNVENPPYVFYNDDKEKPDTLNLSFKIKDSDFENQDNNFEKIYSFNLFDQSMIDNDNYSDVKDKNAGIKLEVGVKALYDKNKNRIPFKYQISSFRFIGQSYNSENISPSYRLDAHLKIDSSNEVIVKTTPLDFSFTKMNNALLNTQKELFEFSSNYSSNVFDDSYFVNENNQREQTNYNVVYQKTKSMFESLILNDKNFKNSMININLLNQPFIQTNYTSTGKDFRTSGKMSLKYAPKNPNKYFRYLEIILRSQILKFSPQNELVDISINQNRLNEIVKNIKTMDLLVLKLNQLSDTEKMKLLNVQCLDTDYRTVIIPTTISFEQISSTNYIQVSFSLYNNFYTIINNKRINPNASIKSDYIKIETFNPDKITISLKEEKIRELASQANDYQDFRNKNSSQDEIKKLVNISTPGSIEKIEFIDTPGFENKISIKVILYDGYIFNNDSNIEILSIANINWKGQNNKSKALKVELNYQSLAKKLATYNSAQDFVLQNSNPNLKEWIGIFNFGIPSNGDGEQTTIDDIHSIKFELVSSSLRKIKVIVQAKEWRYFEYPGSSQKDDSIEFIISNITWKGEDQSSLIGLNINIDMPYLYQLLVKHYKTNSQTSLDSFVDANRKNFLVYSKNDISIIKINPYDEMALNPAIVIATKTGISISFEINEGFYWNKNNDYDNDRFISTYSSFISIEEIIEYHQEYIKPNPEYAVNTIEINASKITKDAKEFDNINQFLNSIEVDYGILDYLNFYDLEDIKKVSNFSIKKIDAHSLEITITLLDRYYFIDEDPSVKTKTISIHNLVFKNEEANFIAISVGINRQGIANKAREFSSRDELVSFYQDKTKVEDYKEFLIISDKTIQGIESIKITNGPSLNSIYFVIRLKSGYYFKGKNPILVEGKILISNLLFKDDPLPEEIFIATSVTIKGNEFLNKAKEFNNFSELKSWLLKEQENNWKSFLEISFNKENENNKNAILRFNIFQKSNHKFIVQIILNDGYYFENEHYTINSQEFVIGNIYFKNDEVPNLKDIDVKFNTKKFYELTKNQNIKNWDDFLELISPQIMNFKDSYNGILWTNTKDQKIFNVISVGLEHNQLSINLELIDGYYFDNDDKSNVKIKLNYSINELKKFYQQGYKKVNDAIIKRNWIIALSVIIPFALVFIVIIFWIIKTKRKNKNSDLGGNN